MVLNEAIKIAANSISKSLAECVEWLRVIFHLKSNEHVYLLIFFVIVSYLGFVGLDNNSFWGDESSTAIEAKNFLKTGRLSGWDGRNLLTYRQGTLLLNNYDTRDPPLGIITTALSFKIFGCSTWAGRMPFVVLGFFSLIVLWFLLKEVFESSLLRWYTMVLVGLSYSFLLCIRQCRYYSLSLLLVLLVYYFYIKFLKHRHFINLVLCTAMAVLLCFTHYPICAAFMPALLMVHLIFHGKAFGRKDWIRVAAATIAFVGAIAPYVFSFQIWDHPGMVKESWGGKTIHLFWTYRELDLIGYFPLIVGILLFFFIFRYRKKNIIPPIIYEWITLIGFMGITITLFARQPVQWYGLSGGLVEIRYLLFFLPFCAGCVATVLWIVHRALSAAVAAVMLALLLCTTLLTININEMPVRFPLPGYIYEVHHNYSTPYDTAIAYLKTHAKKDDIVYTCPDHTLLVLHFYLADSLIMASLLTKESCLPVGKLRKANYPAYIDEYFPHWIIAFGMTQKAEEMLDFFSRGSYAYALDKNIAVFSEDRTRPELPWHSFVPIKVPENSSDGIFIFKRIEKPGARRPGGSAMPNLAAFVPPIMSQK